MSGKIFHQWVDVYDLLVDWQRRLEREGPLFQRLFEQTGVRRVLDVACGPGYHAALFHRWGLEVEGADVSEAMIQRAIALHGQMPGLRWTVRAFQEPVPEPGYFDAAICIGNSLALAGDKTTAAEAVRQMMRAVRPGGLVVIQVLNLVALPEGQLLWQKCLAACIGGQPKLILKGLHRVGNRALVELLLVDLSRGDRAAFETSDQTLSQSEGGRAIPASDLSALFHPDHGTPLRWQAQTEQLLGFLSEELQQMARQAGADQMIVYGGYPEQPYHALTSQDLILVAWRSQNPAECSSENRSTKI
ncbi:MAG: class I SAM-dependent methyltransferase [Thermoguttaceae bacterium]|nr:class I SAM-dependent methyltransferase [Thermoguttaceae bacterium]MDW8039194.1 class I SAM-dependent methyltransferase [Thermoguttaceae bacterium]